jgi:hypothetical protein
MVAGWSCTPRKILHATRRTGLRVLCPAINPFGFMEVLARWISVLEDTGLAIDMVLGRSSSQVRTPQDGMDRKNLRSKMLLWTLKTRLLRS